MYLIHLTGIKNPIEVTKHKGDQIKAALEANPSNDQFISVNDRMFRTSTIKAIEYQPDPRSDREPEPEPLLLTSDGRTKIQEILAKNRKILEERGVFKSKHIDLRPKWESDGLSVFKVCQECGKDLPSNLREFCSGICIEKHSTHDSKDLIT